MKRNVLQVLLALVVTLVVVGGLGGVKALQIFAMMEAGAAFSPPPEAVTSARLVAERWRSSLHGSGTVLPERLVTLAAEVPGMVREVGFESGQLVARGDVIVKLDTSVEQAQLAAAEADARLAAVTLERARALREASASPQADVDVARARAAQAEASVRMLRATLAKKTVRAPFNGRVGLRATEPGQVLAPGTPIVTLQSLDPVLVDLWLPQHDLPELAEGGAVEVRSDVYADEVWDGRIALVDPDVDPRTRSARVRIRVANADGRLRPGMYVDVSVLLPGDREVLTVPATALLFAPYGDSVYLIDEKTTDGGQAQLVARQQFVRVGERRGDLVEVLSGVTAGAQVVSSGAFKLRNGATLVLKNDLAPSPSANPTPADN